MTGSIPTSFLVVLALAFAALQVLLGVLSLDTVSQPAWTLVAMALYMGLMVLALLRTNQGLPATAAWAATVGTAAVTVLVEAGLPRAVWPGYAAWHPAALQCLLVIVALRGRTWAAAAGCTVFAALTLSWAAGTAGGLWQGVRMSLAPVLFIATSVALSRFLTLNDRRAEAKALQALGLLDEAERSRAHTVQAATWAKEVMAVAGPPLALAANPDSELTDEERASMLEAEASLRDRVRGGSLATRQILELVAAARDRGFTVNLLDDRGGPLPQHTLEEVEKAVRAVLAQRHHGTLTVRARPRRAASDVTVAFVPDAAEAEPVYAEL